MTSDYTHSSSQHQQVRFWASSLQALLTFRLLPSSKTLSALLSNCFHPFSPGMVVPASDSLDSTSSLSLLTATVCITHPLLAVGIPDHIFPTGQQPTSALVSPLLPVLPQPVLGGHLTCSDVQTVVFATDRGYIILGLLAQILLVIMVGTVESFLWCLLFIFALLTIFKEIFQECIMKKQLNSMKSRPNPFTKHRLVSQVSYWR